MARQRRGGFPTPEIRGTLGTLLRTTREVLERGAREGRSRLDEALAGRRRDHVLAELGELVLDLIRRGEIDLDELPEARDLVAQLDGMDGGEGAEESEPVIAARPRRRFDERGAGAEDGTVASKTWAPPTRAKGGAGAGAGAAGAKVWRPPAVAAPVVSAPAVRKGGISFDADTDDDLADYMHPDDVPAKDPPDGDGEK